MKVIRSFESRFLTMLILLVTGPSMADGPDIERLTWAGIKWVAGDTTVFMDAVGTDLWDGNAPEGLVPVTADTGRRYAVISHTHNDHFDVETLKDVLGPRGYVICHESQAAYIASRGLKVIAARTWEPVRRGGFVFTAVPAVDGFGSHQVSWVIANKDHRVIHGGDTLWHGQWETIGLQFGPFDVAFLPINGARMPTSVESEVPAVQTPAQAVEAAMLLRAGVLVPIHYGLDDPPNYVEVEDPLGKLFEIAKRREQAVRHLLPGQRLDQTE